MHAVIDLDRYPLNHPESPAWQALVGSARADLDRHGMFNLPGFLRAGVAAQVAADLAPRLETEAFRHARRHNIWFRREVPGLPEGHPAGAMFDTVNHTLCTDQLGGSPILRLYDWPEFARFLAAVMDKPALYTMDDPLAGLNAMGYHAGEALNWHFDRSEFTTTLLLQAPEAGGVFEYRTGLRSDDDPNFDGVARLLQGSDPELQRMVLDPGTLNVFRGRNTAHRVTPIEGARARIIAVFSFYESPGVRFTPEERHGFYGRVG